eukprot:236520-Pelagomonas_calceolata.AAC.2
MPVNGRHSPLTAHPVVCTSPNSFCSRSSDAHPSYTKSVQSPGSPSDVWLDFLAAGSFLINTV